MKFKFKSAIALESTRKMRENSIAYTLIHTRGVIIPDTGSLTHKRLTANAPERSNTIIIICLLICSL